MNQEKKKKKKAISKMSLSRGIMEVDFSLSDDYQMTGTYQLSQWEWDHINDQASKI